MVLSQIRHSEKQNVLNNDEREALKGMRECKNQLCDSVNSIVESETKSIDDIVIVVHTVCPVDKKVKYKFKGSLKYSFAAYCKKHKHSCIYDAEKAKIIFKD